MWWTKVTITGFFFFKHWQINCVLIPFLPACFFLSFLREGIGTSSRMHSYFTTFHSFSPRFKHFYWLLCRQDNIWKDQKLNYKLIQKKSRGKRRRQGKLCHSNHFNPLLQRRTENISSLLQSVKLNSHSN